MNHLEYMHCPTCGLRLEEIREEHKIGCQDCLIVFREAIEKMLVEKIGSITYGGQYVARQEISKTPTNATVKMKQNDISKDDTKDVSNVDTTKASSDTCEPKFTENKMQVSVLELKKLLEKSVAAEDYEAAIYFRNEIKRLEKA